MEEIRTKGIIIDAIDYREYDRLITIFTFDIGVIRAVVKGVKKSTAKSRFAGQILNFVDLILSKRGEYYTVISADLIESYYNIASSYDSFLLATDIIKVIKYVAKFNPTSSELFATFLSTINILNSSDINHNLVYLKFLLETMKSLGYIHEFNICEKCGERIQDYGVVDNISGAIVCQSCATNGSTKLSAQHLDYISSVAQASYVELGSIAIQENDLLDILKAVQLVFKLSIAM